MTGRVVLSGNENHIIIDHVIYDINNRVYGTFFFMNNLYQVTSRTNGKEALVLYVVILTFMSVCSTNVVNTSKL